MASTYLSWTPSNTGTRTTFTWSFWVKRHGLGSYQKIHDADYNNDANYYCSLYFKNDDTINMSNIDAGSTNISWSTTRKFRDTNAWYHIVVTFDTTNATANDRIRCYVNGERETLTGTFAVAQNTDNTFWNRSGNKNWIGAKSVSVSDYLDATLSHFHFIDGTAYDASTFGSTDSTTGEWKINTSPSVTYGTNGFFILKDGNSVTDQSGQGNNWSVAGGTLTNTQDNPSNVFCTMNPLQIPMPSETPTFANGNTRVYGNSSSWMRSYGTIGANSGKWWYELYIGTADASGRVGWDSIDRINDGSDNYFSGLTIQQTSGSVRGGIVGTAAYSPDAVQLPADGGGNATFSQGDYLGMGIDLDNNTITIYKNGSALATNWSYNSYNSSCKANTYGTFVSPSVNWYSASGNQNIYDFNFGNGKFGSSAALTGTTYTDSAGRGVFKYQPPTNYLAWCTRNLNE